MSRDHAHDDPARDQELRASLAARWPLPGSPALRDQLLAAWGGPDRGYHDLQHLAEVLDRLDELAGAHPFDEVAVRLAAWFHDAVYAGGPDDEERSAQWAHESLSGHPAGVDAQEVARLVLLTRAHDPEPDDANGVALCDADLAILAAPAERYATYVAGVRHEYAHVPDELFALGRAEVLRSFVERPHLFSTAYARGHWEPAARANAARELAELAGTGEGAGG